MNPIKLVGLSIVQSLFFVLFSFIIVRVFTLSPDIGSAAAIGIIGGEDGPTAIFISPNPFLLNFIASLIIIFICNLSAFVQSNIISHSILILCNILLVFYCYLLLNHSIVILLSTILVAIIVLITGYIIVRGAVYFNYK